MAFRFGSKLSQPTTIHVYRGCGSARRLVLHWQRNRHSLQPLCRLQPLLTACRWIVLHIQQRPFSSLKPRSTRVQAPENPAFSTAAKDRPQPLGDLLFGRTHGIKAAVDIVPSLNFRHQPGLFPCTGAHDVTICGHRKCILTALEVAEMPAGMCRSTKRSQEFAPGREIIFGDILKNSVIIDMQMATGIKVFNFLCEPAQVPGIDIPARNVLLQSKMVIAMFILFRGACFRFPLGEFFIGERLIRQMSPAQVH